MKILKKLKDWNDKRIAKIVNQTFEKCKDKPIDVQIKIISKMI